jgi:hypothetical protein
LKAIFYIESSSKSSNETSKNQKFFLPLHSKKKEDFSFLHISHRAQKVSILLDRQQGVTKNKLYNAKG